VPRVSRQRIEQQQETRRRDISSVEPTSTDCLSQPVVRLHASSPFGASHAARRGERSLFVRHVEARHRHGPIVRCRRIVRPAPPGNAATGLRAIVVYCTSSRSRVHTTTAETSLKQSLNFHHKHSIKVQKEPIGSAAHAQGHAGGSHQHNAHPCLLLIIIRPLPPSDSIPPVARTVCPFPFAESDIRNECKRCAV
jgi:hypothetical protein